jgi:hypothetical protein
MAAAAATAAKAAYHLTHIARHQANRLQKRRLAAPKGSHGSQLAAHCKQGKCTTLHKGAYSENIGFFCSGD